MKKNILTFFVLILFMITSMLEFYQFVYLLYKYKISIILFFYANHFLSKINY